MRLHLAQQLGQLHHVVHVSQEVSPRQLAVRRKARKQLVECEGTLALAAKLGPALLGFLVFESKLLQLLKPADSKQQTPAR